MIQPDYSAAEGLLIHLNSDELKEMLNDDTKFEEIVRDLKQIKDLETEKEMLMASNRSLADFNLSREPQLVDGREKVQELAEQGQSICKSIQEKSNELKSKSSTMTADTAFELLKTAATEIEKESETVAENFLSGEFDLDQFLEQFASRRKLMYLRKVKVEKMTELMSHKPKIFSGPGYLPSGNFYPPMVSNSVPYPTGPLNMPMPSALYRPRF